MIRDSSAGIYVYTGGETPEVGDGRLRDNEFFDNEFAVDYRAVKLMDCDDTLITGEKGLCAFVGVRVWGGRVRKASIIVQVHDRFNTIARTAVPGYA